MNKVEDNKKRIPIGFIIAMVVFGTIAIFVKNIDLSSGEKALYRAVLALIVISGYLLVTRSKINIKEIKKELILLLISGAAMGFNWIFLFESYNYTTIAVSTLCYYMAPIIVTVVCAIFFKEKLSKKEIICFSLATLGVVLVVGTIDLSGKGTDLTGILFGLGAAVLYATVILINKGIKKVEGIHRTFFQFISAILVLLPYVLLTDGINISSLNQKGWINLIILGVIHTGIAYCIYFSSMRNMKGQEVAVLSYIDPFIALIISVIVDVTTVYQIIGAVMIIGFSIINEVDLKKMKKHKQIESVISDKKE